MKILLALAAFALAAAFVVSATMGAGDARPRRRLREEEAGGRIGAQRRQGPAVAASLSPPSIKGTGFKPGENVTVKLIDSLKATRRAKANGSGSFTIRMPERTNQCGGLTAVAVGDKGSRASFQFAQVMCAVPSQSQ